MSSVHNRDYDPSFDPKTREAPAGQPRTSDSEQLENQFLALMVAQIQNQDPTKPVDSSEFIHQFAAMSQVKSLENMSKLTQSNLILLDNLQTLTAASLVGQQVKVKVDSIQVDGEVIKGSVELEHSAADVEIILTDSNGVQVKVPLGAREAGPLDFEIDPEALGLAKGDYKIEVKTGAGESPPVEIAGLVTGVRVTAEGTMLDVKGAGRVPLHQVIEFSQGSMGALFQPPVSPFSLAPPPGAPL